MANDWVIDPSNPNRATYTDPSGTVHEAFKEAPVATKKPAPVQYEASPNGYVPSPGARMGPAKGQEATLKGEERGIGDYFNEAYERATSMAGTGEIGALARGMEDLFNIDDRYEQGLRGGTSEQREDARDQEQVRKVRETRALWNTLDELDPAWRKDGTTLGNVARFSAGLLGDIAGNANPSYMIGGGATVAERMAVQGAANAGIDAALQGNELRTGIQDEFDPRRMALQFLAGATIQGGLEGGIRGGKALSDAFNPKAPELDFDSSLHPRETISGEADVGTTDLDFAQEMRDALEGGAPQEFVDDIYRRYGKTPEGRTVPSVYGADADFRPADEAFTDSLVTGKQEAPLREPSAEDIAAAETAVANPKAANDIERRAEVRPAVSRDDVIDEISEKTKTWRNAPEFEVVDKVDQIADPKIRAAVDDPSVIGFYGEDGKVRIISGNLRDKSEIAPAMFHESLGHHGLAQEFGQNLDVMMQRLYDKTPELQKAVDDWRAEYGERYGDIPITTQVEEVLAKMSEGGELSRTVIDRVKDFIKNYARKIGIDLDYSNREILSILAGAHQNVTRGAKTAETPSGTRFIKTWHGSGADFDKFDHSKMGSGEGAQVYGWGTYLTETPDIAKGYRDRIGSEEVTYRGDTVAPKKVQDLIDLERRIKKDFDDLHPEHADDLKARNAISKIVRGELKPQDVTARSLIEGRIYKADYLDGRPDLYGPGTVYDDIANFIKDSGIKTRKTGKLYEVEIPDDSKWVEWDFQPEAELRKVFKEFGLDSRDSFDPELQKVGADWREATRKTNEAEEAMVAHQAEMLAKYGPSPNAKMFGHDIPNTPLNGPEHNRSIELEDAFVKADKEEVRLRDLMEDLTPTAGELYKKLGAKLGSEEAASKALAEKGYTGVKYLDGNSRDRGEGSHNYVVFDDNTPKITNKYMKRPPERPTLEGDFDPNAEIRSSEELDRAIREIAKGVKTTPQTWAETDALAGDLGLKPSEVAKRRRIDVEEVPQLITAMVETMERQQARVRDIAEKVRNGDDSSATLARAAQQIAVLADILPTVMRLRSASGRALNTFAQLSKDGRNPTDFLEALKDFGHDGQPMDKDSIIKLLTNISEINDPTAAARLATDAFKPRAEDVIFSLWYNINLLSRPSTQYNNFMGTMENVLFELGAKTLAVPAGQVRKAMGSTDRVAAREVLSRVAGATIGALQGIKNAPLAFKLAMPITGVSKEAYRPAPIMDIAKDITKNSSKAVRLPTLGVAGALETTSRVMAMADEFFRSVAHTSEQWGQATREALKDDGPGSFGEKVYRYNKNPTEERIPKRRLDLGLAKYSDPVNERRWEIYDESKSQADIATFRDMSSPLMKRYEDIMRPKEGDTAGARTGRFAMRVLVPFARMGDAMTRSKIRMTPLIGMLDRYNKADWAAGGARRDVVVGRMVIGLGLGALAASQVLNGERSGNGPSDYDLRMEMESGGWKPNAVRQEDGSWEAKHGLGAVNTYMNTVASLTEALAGEELTQENYDKKVTEAFGKVMASFVKDAGVENLVNIVSADPESSGLSNAFGGLASSFASPGFLQSYNQYIGDTSVRSAIDADAPASGRERGPGEIMRGRVRSAWGDDTLPQKYDVYGREKERPGGYLNMLTGGRYGTPEKDEAVLELQRLSKGRDKALINMPEKTLSLGSGDDRIEKKLTEGEFQKYVGLSGYYIREIVREQMKTPEWKKMSDAERVQMISKPKEGIKAFARKAAREYLFIERNDDPLPPEEETPIEEEALIE